MKIIMARSKYQQKHYVFVLHLLDGNYFPCPYKQPVVCSQSAEALRKGGNVLMNSYETWLDYW